MVKKILILLGIIVNIIVLAWSVQIEPEQDHIPYEKISTEELPVLDTMHVPDEKKLVAL